MYAADYVLFLHIYQRAGVIGKRDPALFLQFLVLDFFIFIQAWKLVQQVLYGRRQNFIARCVLAYSFNSLAIFFLLETVKIRLFGLFLHCLCAII